MCSGYVFISYCSQGRLAAPENSLRQNETNQVRANQGQQEKDERGIVGCDVPDVQLVSSLHHCRHLSPTTEVIWLGRGRGSGKEERRRRE
jgi:hypothetical protein